MFPWNLRLGCLSNHSGEDEICSEIHSSILLMIHAHCTVKPDVLFHLALEGNNFDYIVKIIDVYIQDDDYISSLKRSFCLCLNGIAKSGVIHLCICMNIM